MDAETQLREVQRLARALYGELPSSLRGAAHIVAAVRHGERWHAIAINEHAPKSETDFFVLNFWRAHSDAILTTGQVLRAEAHVSYELQGPLAQGLARYRAEVLGKKQPAWCAILTRSAQLPAAHPVFADRMPHLVLTTPESAAPLTAALGRRAEVLSVAALDARKALSMLEERGARVILVEAGPSTVAPLYTAPSRIDQLLWSSFDGELDPRALGPELPSDELLFGGLRCMSDSPRQEPSGPWRFQRWQR
jgi:riboflavin biosynthesis pyrimidine reductase